MKNIIRINLDVNERNESNIGIPLPQKVIRSKDTAVIIEMRIIGYDVNDGYTFTLLSEYTKSKRHTLYTIGDRLKIEGNVVTFVPPAELISTLEIVTNTLYIEKSGMSLDFSKFHYLAQLSEVDNTVGPVKEVYDDNYQALIDELEFKYMLIEDLTAEYVAAQVAEARVGEDGTIYRFLKERLDVEHQKVTAQVGEVSNRLELTNNEIIDARGGKPTLRVRLNEISRVDEYGKYWTLIDGEWEERVGQSQLINVRGEVAWAMAEAEQAKEDAIKAYEDAVAEAKRSADIEDALIRTKIQQGLSAVETELTEAKQEAQNAYTNAVAEAEAKVQAKDEEYQIIFGDYDSAIESIEEDSQTAKTNAEQALTEAGISTDLAQTAKDLATTAQTNASTAMSNASQAQADASTAVSNASQAKADASQAQEDAQTAITEAGEAVDSANTAKTNAQTALEDAQTALSTAENADTKSGLAEAAANTAKTNAQTALDNSSTAITNAADAITKAGQAEDTANTAKTNAQTAIDDAQSALTEAGKAKTTADTLSIKVDDLEGEVELKASQNEVDGISGTVSTHTTTISQQATAIASKADKTVVDTLSGTVSDQGTLITQNATDIKTKASQTEVDTVKGTVDDHTTEISQNATDIASKASSASVSTLTGRVNTAETTITQHATSIASKASQTEVDTVKGTVSGHTTTLSQHATAISSKAESELVDTIKGTVDTHTTEISQNATDIASKASSVSVSTLTGRVDTHATEISQNATDIASKASTTTVNTLTGRVDTAESNISQNATAITQRVTTTTYNTGIANKENTVLKQTTAPTHVNGRLWLDTSVTPNILKRSNGTTWIKATPTTPGEVGAYSQAAGAGLAGRLTTAETNITQTATAITSKADKSTVDTLEGIVSTQGTTITQQADLIASKASQTEVDTVKGTVSGHTTTLSQHANQIASKAETTLVNAIKGTVDNHTTEINQNATDIASKASSTSVNALTGRVSTAETTLTQHATSITSKASQTEVDDISGTVSGHTTTLSQHASQISSKAESSLVNAIKGTVDTHTTEISQNATDIASKASSSSVNTLTGRVSTAETAIGQNATAITSKASQSEVDTVKGTVSGHTSTLSQHATQISARLTSSQVSDLVDDKGLAQVTYVDNQINATADGIGYELTRVEGKIDGLQIGGRNLLRQSNVHYENTGYPVARYELTEPILDNAEVTLSIKGNLGRDYFGIYNSGGSVNLVVIRPSDKRDGVYKKTFKWTIRTSSNARIEVYPMPQNTGTATTIEWVKLEYGNTATDWTPAPEDTLMENDFTVWKNTYDSTIEGITSELTKTAKITDLNGMVTESILSTKNFVTAGTMTTTLSNYAQKNNVPTNTQFNTLKNSYDSMVQTIGTNGNKIAQMVMTDSVFQTNVLTDGNLVQNGSFTNGSRFGWGDSLGTVEKVDDRVASWYGRTTVRDLYSTYNISVVSGETLHVSIKAWGNRSQPVKFGVRFYDKDGEGLGWFDAVSRTVTTAPTDYTGTIKVPTKATHGRVWVNIDLYNDFGIVWFTDAIITRSATQSQVTQLAGSWALTLKSGNDIKTQINASTNSIRLASKFIHLSGTSLIDNTVIKSAHIDSLNANKITGNTADFNTIRAGVLTADAVIATHIKSDNALIDNIFATQALVDRLWAKAIWTNKITAMEIDAGKITSGTINAARLNVTDLRSKILTANVIDATQINASAAVFNKLFSTTSATDRLVARGAWIENANIKGINADKITAGTISADRISTSSLTNIDLNSENLIRNSAVPQQGHNWSTFNSTITDRGDGYEHLYSSLSHSGNIFIGREKNEMPLEPNTYYVYSMWIYAGASATVNATTPLHCWISSGGVTQGGLASGTNELLSNSYIPASTWTRIVRRFKTNSANDIVFTPMWYGSQYPSGISVRVRNIQLEKGMKATDWRPSPYDTPSESKFSRSGSVEIHGGNIKADTLDVGAITGDLGEFINLSLKAQNSQASLSGSSFKIESIANSQSYIEMSNVPEIRARSANSAMAVMGQGQTNYSVDNAERFFIGTKISGSQHGIMIRKNQGWAIMREADSFGGTPAKYYTVKYGQQRVAVVETLMADSTVTEVPTGNATQFIINSNYLARLNGFSTSTSSTIAAPWPNLTTGDLIKYAEGTPGNESGIQSIFKIWTSNNTSVSAFDAHVTFNTGYSGASDRRIKHNIKDTYVEALSHINSLKFKEFKYNSDNRYEPLGIIAQDSGILRVKWEEMESIDIQRSIMLGLKGVQELHTIVKDQAEEIKHQTEEIKEQAEEIKQLKEIINQ